MARQSISFTPPNDAWLRARVDSQEYASKSEVVNDLIRKARELERIQTQLIAAEQSGFSTGTPEEMLQRFKKRARKDGKV